LGAAVLLLASALLFPGCSTNVPQGAGAPAATSASQQVAHPSAARMESIHNFTGGDGSGPIGMVEAGRENIRRVHVEGVAMNGGDVNGDGVIFGLAPGKNGTWREQTLYAFRGSSSSDGSKPSRIKIIRQWSNASPAALVVTESGGTNSAGTLVALTPNSAGTLSERFLYSFGGPGDGAKPEGGLYVNAKGVVFGTTADGGYSGDGTVYRMQPRATGTYQESVVHSFGYSDGAHPISTLIGDAKGDLYGTTLGGGPSGANGTVFRMQPAGSGYSEKVLYAFRGYPNDGSAPFSCVTRDGKGDLFGTTVEGGTMNYGTVYKLMPRGGGYTERIIWNFGVVAGDGAYPTGPVLISTDGKIFGTTQQGGPGGVSQGVGTVYELTPSSSGYVETVYGLDGKNGAIPVAGLSIDAQGRMYGTAVRGGKSNDGTVFLVGYTKNVAYGCEKGNPAP
jgi:uncharacterized repeat protein (TIGR03803 family)